MEKSFYSASWYRVAELKPRLRSYAHIHRQQFRGGLWYVLQDRTSGRFHRFTPAAYLVISLMNGERTVDEIWQLACRRLGDDALTQDEIIRLLSQLHQADVLRADIAPDFDEMAVRAGKVRRRKLIAGAANPLALRLPLLDPDAFLSATLPLVRPAFSWVGAVVFIAIVGYALVLTGVHWSALTANIVDRVFAGKSLLLLVFCYPMVKTFHELGHAYAIKRWGGEVHELGMMLLVFMPVPYVDASSSSAFREKWQRALVGSAGIAVELLLASLALFVWLNIEDGLVRAFAFNVMVIGGVSTIVFNGNPLLRFDGYYVLSDVLEIPNLADRAKRYLGYLVLRYGFAVTDATCPVTAPGEPFWFVVYGTASFIYRIFIVAAIALLVASKFFIIGVLIAIWSMIMMALVPMSKSLWSVIRNPAVVRNRRRTFAVCAGVLAVCVAALLVVPLPYRTVAEGIVWSPGEPGVFAATDGVVVAVLQEPNTTVGEGRPLLQMEDALIDAKVRVLEATVKELRLRRDAVYATDPVQTRLLEEQISRNDSELALNRQRQSYLTVRSPAVGRFILRRPADLIGKFVRKGEQVGYVAELEHPVVLAIVAEDAADLVRKRDQAVEFRRVNQMRDVRPASILREVPNLNDRLPSAALSTLGGGEMLLDPRDPKNLRTLSKNLQLEIHPAEPMPVAQIGGRAYIRFDHGSEPLGWRLYRELRQLFLRRFNV
jgi:putative peptide zinc metalloprotease protein